VHSRKKGLLGIADITGFLDSRPQEIAPSESSGCSHEAKSGQIRPNLEE